MAPLRTGSCKSKKLRSKCQDCVRYTIAKDGVCRFCRPLKYPEYKTPLYLNLKKIWRESNRIKIMWLGARARAKEKNVPFTIEQSDIIIPEICPITRKLIYRDSYTREFSPSIDCIIPDLGYIPSNVAVISFRGNRLKNDASIEEVERIAAYMRKHAYKETFEHGAGI